MDAILNMSALETHNEIFSVPVREEKYKFKQRQFYKLGCIIQKRSDIWT